MITLVNLKLDSVSAGPAISERIQFEEVESIDVVHNTVFIKIRELGWLIQGRFKVVIESPDRKDAKKSF